MGGQNIHYLETIMTIVYNMLSAVHGTKHIQKIVSYQYSVMCFES